MKRSKEKQKEVMPFVVVFRDRIDSTKPKDGRVTRITSEGGRVTDYED